MLFQRCRKLITFLILAIFVVAPIAPLINQALGGNGGYLDTMTAGEDLLARQNDAFDQDGDALDLDDDEQTPQDDHFNFIAMAFAPSYSLVMDIPRAEYSVAPTFEPLSHISAPLARPPRTLA